MATFGSVSAKRGLPVLRGTRLSLFFFVASEQLLVSIIPLYSKEIASVDAGSMVISMPMVAFVLSGLLGNTLAGWLIGLRGLKEALICGYLLAFFGYLFSAGAANVAELVGARAAAGVGYSIVTLGLQVKMLAEKDARLALSSFTSIIMSALALGSGVGGFLAAFLGYRPVFLLSAFCVGLVSLSEWFSPAIVLDKAAKAGAASGFGPLRYSEFRDLLLNVAVPVKIVLSGFVFYFIPLYLQSQQKTTSYIGSIIILYSVFMIPSVYIGSLLLSKIKAAHILISSAAIGTGVLLLIAPLNVALSVAGIGVCHGVVSVPALTAVMAISARVGVSSTDFLALVRSGERVGSVLGPALAAFIMGMAGFDAVSWVFGVMALALAVSYSHAARKKTC